MSVPPKPRRPRTGTRDRQAQRDDTKTRLINAAEQWFTQQGFDSVSVADIARSAGVVPSLINTYFLGKAGLLYAVVQRHNEPQFESLRLAAAKPGTAFKRLEHVILTSATMDLERINLLAAMQSLSWTWPAETEAKNAEEIQPFREILANVLRDGIASSEMREIPVEHGVQAIWAIYTMGLRPAIFVGRSARACATDILVTIQSLFAR